MAVTDPTIDPITGLPLLNPQDVIQQIPLGVQIFPYEDFEATARPTRGAMAQDDILPTSAFVAGQHPTTGNAQTVETDAAHAMKVFVVNQSGGGGGVGGCCGSAQYAGAHETQPQFGGGNPVSQLLHWDLYVNEGGYAADGANPSRVIVLSAGLKQIRGQMLVLDGGSGFSNIIDLEVDLFVNGALPTEPGDWNPVIVPICPTVSFGQWTVPFNFALSLAVNDYVEVNVSSNSDVSIGGTYTVLTISGI